MRLGGKVDDGTWTMLGEQPFDQCAVSNITPHKDVATIIVDPVQIFKVACIGQLI